MKYLLILSLISSAVAFGSASNSPENLLKASRSPSKKIASRSVDKGSDSPQNSPKNSPKDRRLLMKTVSSLSREQKDLHKVNPYALPPMNREKQKMRSRSFSGGESDSLSSLRSVSSVFEGPILLPEERGEAVGGIVSPRNNFPTSKRGTLGRVASLSNVDKTMALASAREEQKQEYRNKLSPGEQRLFDVLGLGNLEFIKTQPHLFPILNDASDGQVRLSYDAYLRSTVTTLQTKLAAMQLLVDRTGSSPRNDSPRDDSPRSVAGLILDAQKDDLSPRKGVYETHTAIQERIRLDLAAAEQDRDRLMGVLKQNDSTSSATKQNRDCASSSSSSIS